VTQRHPLLCIDRLSVRYGQHLALHDVSFSLGPGEIVAVVGPNGAGKSSLFKAIVGLVPHGGTVTFTGRHCHHDRHDRLTAAYVPQRADIEHDFPINVTSVVMAGRRPFMNRLGWPSQADRREATEALGRVGLDHFGARAVAELSGGELQRVFIARALAQGADVLLLDEAMSGIDEPSTDSLLLLFNELTADGISLLVSTHDLALARRRFTRCLALNATLVEDGHPSSALSSERLEATFGSARHRRPMPATMQSPMQSSMQ
jgi:ABC-type Mn2+/Zn2+ transport system ATPase subunit